MTVHDSIPTPPELFNPAQRRLDPPAMLAAAAREGKLRRAQPWQSGHGRLISSQ
jgi:hypothetical protein